MFAALVWIGYTILLVMIIFTSWILAKYERFEKKIIRNIFVVVGSFIGIFSFLMVFLTNHESKMVSSIMDSVFLSQALGIIGRIYTGLYIRAKETTTTLDKVSEVIISGPYRWVRHPQYSTGILSILGWFMIWGAINCLLITPLLISIILLQAVIEEKYILEREFGERYKEYKNQVGMFVPKIRK